jgi:hypothetical protein
VQWKGAGSLERDQVKPWGKWHLPGSRDQQSTWKTLLLAVAGTIFELTGENPIPSVKSSTMCTAF